MNRHGTKDKRDKCETRKVRYPDIESARVALQKSVARSKREVVPCRFYECHLCRGFHLTSKPDRYIA